jgi:hypothetical protein
MRAGQGFGRWGFVLGNVLIAFGAPVFVTSLVATVAARRSSTATADADAVAIVAGAVFVIAGLVLTVAAGTRRQAPPPAPPPQPIAGPAAHHTTDWPAANAIEPLPLTLNSLDDYYTGAGGRDGGLDLADDEPFRETYHRMRPVPRPRNARAFGSGDRFCEPTVTGTRSNGTRRHPPAG